MWSTFLVQQKQRVGVCVKSEEKQAHFDTRRHLFIVDIVIYNILKHNVLWDLYDVEAKLFSLILFCVTCKKGDIIIMGKLHGTLKSVVPNNWK